MISVHVDLIGRFGNACFQYAHARAFAEEHEMALTTSRWVGESIFDLPDHSGEPGGAVLSGYKQDQASVNYTRKKAKEWLKFKPEIADKLALIQRSDIVIHKRRGDYVNSCYPLISMRSYEKQIERLGLVGRDAVILSEEHPSFHSAFGGELSFLPDFYRMMTAKVLLRANSSFSWWSAMLGDCEVYSPIISGSKGGAENEVEFAKGNWPRLAMFPFTTDLHVEEE